YRSICEKFDIGRATALKSVRRVTRALVHLAPIFITWPKEERIEEVFKGFAMLSGFSKVIGSLDGTHINIKALSINPECYINRKGHHSIQLQAICDHELRFIHCLAGHVGSVHDQRVFRLSEVSEFIQDPEKFPHHIINNIINIVADAAYSLHNHVMTPYQDNGHLTDRQKNYNFCHSSARTTIERAFGLLKGRFRSLLTILDMDRIDCIPDFILACCVLHNICLLRDDEFTVTNLEVIENNCNIHSIECANRNAYRIAGHLKRDVICNNLMMRNI
ncbi:putative nuclease HARBI1, partial [Harpegnathos saltator]|uniref:putative nuclease HARBI1 n=1 Tax=Harpegnathos saltator TaxID=610380 RepID=UPI000DBEE347